MKKSIILSGLLTSIITLSSISPLLANADSVSSSSTQTIQVTPAADTSSLQNALDNYVSVENNQYILTIPDDIQLNATQIEQAKADIQLANQQITLHNGVINLTNKSYFIPSRTVRSGYTWGNFWWGTRYYFRSNAAVYQMDHDLDNFSIMSGITALWAPAIGVSGAAYFQKVKSDLDYFNNTHSQNYINMDVSWAGVYSIYTV